jgi:hypothetical protein
MNTFIILRRSGWSDVQQLEKAASRSSRVNLHEMAERVRWIRSYVTKESDGFLGTVCVFQAKDAETVREHARRAGLPADEVLPVGNTIVLADDPKQPR